MPALSFGHLTDSEFLTVAGQLLDSEILASPQAGSFINAQGIVRDAILRLERRVAADPADPVPHADPKQLSLPL